LTYAELDNTIIDLLQNKIQPIDVRGDTGAQLVGQSLSNEILQVVGGTGISTTITSDSAGETIITITNSQTEFVPASPGELGATTPDVGNFTDLKVKSAASTVKELQLHDEDNSNYVGFKAPTTVSTNKVYVLPDTDGTNGQVLTTNGTATLSWTTASTELSTDTSPQLGGALDVNGQSIVSTSNADIQITPDGAGKVVIDGLNYPTSDGTAGQFLRTDGFNNLTFADVDIPNITAGDNISITSPDSAGAISIALRNPLNQPVVGGDQIISQVVLKDYAETVYQLSYAATITPDVANGNVQEITLTGGVTFAGFTSPLDGQSITLIIHQDGTGGRTFTEGLDSANQMLFAGGTSTLSTAGNATDIMSIFYASGVYYASLSTNFS
jgi:hypothetical protein